MGLGDRVIITSNEYEKQKLEEFLVDNVDKGINRGFANLSEQYKLDISAIHNRIDELQKFNAKKLKMSLLYSAILIGLILFKSRDPLEALIELAKVLISGGLN